MVEQNLLTIYKNKVSISCYSEFHAITGNHQTTKELLTVAYCLLTSRRFLACAGRIFKEQTMSWNMSSTTFKERFRNHKKSIANPLYATNTELSKYVWSLKEKNKEYNIKWDIVKQVPSYKPGGKQCSLCSNVKLYILKAEKGSILNKRSELFSRCIHQRRFLAGKFNRANSTSARKKPT